MVAITLQLTLAFGHVHADVAGQASELAALAADGSDGAQPSNPATPGDRDYCAVCAVLSLMAGSQTADAPSLPMPAAFATIAVTANAEAFHAKAADPAFRSRAPPLA